MPDTYEAPAQRVLAAYVSKESASGGPWNLRGSEHCLAPCVKSPATQRNLPEECRKIAKASGLYLAGSLTSTLVNAEFVGASEYRSSNTGISRTVTWIPGSWLSASAVIPRMVAS